MLVPKFSFLREAYYITRHCGPSLGLDTSYRQADITTLGYFLNICFCMLNVGRERDIYLLRSFTAQFIQWRTSAPEITSAKSGRGVHMFFVFSMNPCREFKRLWPKRSNYSPSGLFGQKCVHKILPKVEGSIFVQIKSDYNTNPEFWIDFEVENWAARIDWVWIMACMNWLGLDEAWLNWLR